MGYEKHKKYKELSVGSQKFWRYVFFPERRQICGFILRDKKSLCLKILLF